MARYSVGMLKGQDVVLLLRLLGDPHVGSTQRLADATGLSPATVHRALHRLADAGLYDLHRRRVPEAAAEEFLVHAVKYLFPAVRGSETRGVPAAWAAPPLSSDMADDGLPPVWPHPSGKRRGIALQPLHPAVPELALSDDALWQRLALVDAIRAGDARIRRLAEEALVDSLRDAAAR
jgi:DNA-binding transcriptional ArsR family regulator